MSIDLSGLDFNSVKASAGFEPLPAGTYSVQIMDMEQKTTKSGTGAYLQITMTVQDGPHANRKLFDRLNLWNANPTAAQIALSTFKAINIAAGQSENNANTDALLGKLIRVRVTVRKSEEFGDSNEIKGYEELAGIAKVPTGARHSPAAAKAPWAK